VGAAAVMALATWFNDASIRQSVCPIDRQQQQQPVGLLLSDGIGSTFRSIAAGTMLKEPVLSSSEGSVMLRANGGGSTQILIV